ncbi:Putative disease resistance RPP13-like protein 1 [Linum perenne]
MEVLASVSGALLSESVKMLIQKLDAHELLMYYRQAGEVMAELKMWEGMLRKIYAALDDAEEKQMTSRLVSIWLSELRGLAYDAEDVLDSFSTEQLRRKLKEEAASSSASKIQRLIPGCFPSISLQTLKFNAEMMSKIQDVTARLRKINADKDDLNLKNTYGRSMMGHQPTERLPTTSLVNESRVYGRENDEHAILQLLKAEAADVSISVIPIIGMGGLGKTTLAQLVLSRAKSGFDFTAWVSVGEDFDVHRITKTILDSAGSEGKDLNSLQEQLKEKLSRKKFLIVLDDVWNENYEKWVLCRAPLESGSSGSKIVITTRNASVASIMGTDPPYHLKELAFNGCLSLFAEHGLGAKTFAAHSNLEEIGNKIVEKCRGLPLAVKVMGGLLRGKQDPRLWEEVLNSKIWEFPESNGILPALRVSYYHLPSHLKQCFAYCGILPKDFEIEEDELVLLWMAEGFLAQAKEKKYAKDLGHRYFRDLVSRSFFQQSSEDKSRFTMHDLINDLAEFESRSICFKLDGNLEETNSCSKVRYSSFNRHTYDLLPRFEVFNNMKNLRSFLPLPMPLTIYKRYFLSNKMLFELIPKLRYLRVLSLAGYKLEKLPEMIFALEHLRYLNLSYTDIVSLSELVGELVNLQTLRLQGCRRLVKLPRSIGNLINLQLLDNQKTYNLQELPAEIAKLINLITLPRFVVGKGMGLGIVDLGKLVLLQGKLHIIGLCNVLNSQEVELANLKHKQGVEDLTLEWSSDFQCSRNATNEFKVLNLLMPHLKLKKFWIKSYAGIHFPTWVGDPKFADMVHLELLNCKQIESLPPLGQLPSLMMLTISGLDGVKEVGAEFYGRSSGNNSNLTGSFPALETLIIRDMSEWVEWSCFAGMTERTTAHFPKLLNLTIRNCPKLIGQLPNSLPCLQKLVIRGCQRLANLPGTLLSLSELDISECDKMIPVNVCSLNSLAKLKLKKLASLVSMQEVRGLGALACLKDLSIDNCEQLLFLQEGAEGLLPSSLESLWIYDCPKLEKLSNNLHELTHLSRLSVHCCPKLISFGEPGLPSSISDVWISSCPSLKSLVIRGITTIEDRSQMSYHLESLSLDGCSSLTIFPSGMFTESLKYLSIGNLTMQSLEELCHLALPHLTDLSIQDSPELEWFPDIALPLLRIIKRLRIRCCKNLRSLPNQLPELTSLLLLWVNSCGSLKSFPKGGFPSNLIVLRIEHCKSLGQPISEWGINRLTSLKRLTISGECPSTKLPTYFPDNEGSWLPTSLTFLLISEFSELKSISRGLGCLTSIEELMLMNCPKVRRLPKKGLPASLGSLKLNACPGLKKRCLEQKGEYWPLMQQIPCVEIDSIESSSYSCQEP